MESQKKTMMVHENELKMIWSLIVLYKYNLKKVIEV
jgi:hypothetical protein